MGDMKNKLINEVNKEVQELEVIRKELRKTYDFYRSYDGSDTAILYLKNLSDVRLIKKICEPIGIDFRTMRTFIFHRYDNNGKRVAHGNNVRWDVKKKLKDYYAKTTKTEDDIKDVKHEHEKQIRRKLTNYRKENKLSIRALAEIFGLNVSTIREWMLDGDRKLNRKNYKIILSNLKHLENDTTDYK